MCIERISSLSTQKVIDRTLYAGGILLAISIIAWGILAVGYLNGHFEFSSILFSMPACPITGGLILFVIAGCLFYLKKKKDVELPMFIRADREEVRRAAEARYQPSQPLYKDKTEITPTVAEHLFTTNSDFKEGVFPLHLIMLGGLENPLTENIAKHWITNAATRVFQSPFRGIVEIVNNALDAVNPQHPIGQHGLCFFSVLSFLTKKFKIEITTTYLKEGAPFSYKMIIFRKKGSVSIKVEKIKNKTKTGTTISILSDGGAFTKKDLKKMVRALYTLQFYPHGKITVLNGSSESHIGKGSVVNAYVTLAASKVTIQDAGCGISLEVASKYLFVPSATTKKREEFSDYPICLPEFVEYKGKKEKKGSMFLLSVGGVISMEVPLETTLKNKGQVLDLHLSLPESTHLTLSHDYVQLDDPKKKTEKYLQQVLDHVIDRWIKNKEERNQWSLVLFALFQGFSMIEKRNYLKNGCSISTSILESLQRLSTQENVVPIPFGYYGFFLKTLKELGLPQEHNFLFLPYHRGMWSNFDRLERLLIETASSVMKEGIIEGMNLIFIPDSELKKMMGGRVATFGCNRILFVATSLLEESTSAVQLGSSIVRQFSEKGKKIEVVQENKKPFAVIKGDPYSHVPAQFSLGDFFLDFLPNAPYRAFSSKHTAYLKSLLVLFPFEEIPVPMRYGLNKKKEIYYMDERTLDSITLSPEETTKVMLHLLLMRKGICVRDSTHSVQLSDEKVLWPIKGEWTLEQLEELMFVLSDSNQFVIGEEHLKNLDLATLYETVDSFAPYLKFLNLSITKPFFHLALLKEFFFAKASFVIEEIIYRVKCYYTFSDHELDAPIAAKKTIKTQEALLSGCLFSTLHAFLKDLENYEEAFNKAFRFLKEYALENLDIQKRNMRMQLSRTLVIYDFLESSGIAFLAQLRLPFHAVTVTNQLKKMLLDFCQSEKELLYVCILIKKMNTFGFGMQDAEEIMEKIGLFISNYLRHQVDLDIHKVEKINQDFEIFSKYLREKTAFSSYLYSSQPFISQDVQNLLSTATSFRSSQLLYAVFTDKDIHTKVRSHTSISEYFSQQGSLENFKMLEDCIQHGTERPSKEATLIETFQNSTDAIRSFSRRVEQMDPQVEATQEARRQVGHEIIDEIQCQVMLVPEDKVQCVYEISDPIGIDSINTLLINVLVPNYSEKKGLVGEMGNGFFQIYREAKMITLTTRLLEDPSLVYFVLIEPIVDSSDGVVRDATITLLDVSKCTAPDFFGTKIRVLFRNEDLNEDAVKLEALCFQELISKKLSGSLIRISQDRNIRIFLRQGDKSRELSAVAKNVLIASEMHPFEFHQLEMQDAQSSVLTQGCPFRPLPFFLIESGMASPKFAEHFATGWCLNFPAKTYLPVQNRTRIQLKSETQEQIKTFICETFYYRLLLEEKNFPGYSHIPHYRSKVSNFESVYPGYLPSVPSNEKLRQNLLSLKDHRPIQLFYLYYQPYFLANNTYRSFIEYIDDAYDTLVPRLEDCKEKCKQGSDEIFFKNECVRLFQEWQRKHFQEIKGNGLAEKFFVNIVVGWLKEKVNTFSLCLFIENPNNSPKQSLKELYLFDTLNLQRGFCPQELATFILKSYCDQFCLINQRGQVGIKLEYSPLASYKGYYSHKTNTISINCVHFKLSDLLEIGLGLITQASLSEITGAEDLFLPSLGRGGTLNHELEHARRGEGCNSIAGHNDHLDAEGHFASFEACATSYARKAINEGLLLNWQGVVHAYFQKKKIEIEAFKQDIATLREFESTL